LLEAAEFFYTRLHCQAILVLGIWVLQHINLLIGYHLRVNHFWQMLPLGPAGMANSPYMSLSAFAGSPLLIDPKEFSITWLVGSE